jgi:predicted ATPase/class 3 adenylate cyclase/DNA-binding CsgD family transcriptional regulator/tetratricopeptide (TPR) repeat protein
MSPARLFGLARSWVALMAEPRTRTVTFLLTDVEGSTAFWEQNAAAMRQALDCHDALLVDGITAHGGVVVKSRGEGDSVFAVFDAASDAVTAAVALQASLQAASWPTTAPLRVRMALHTGEAQSRDGDYFGPVVNRCARLRAAAHGGQIVLSQATADLIRDSQADGLGLQDLGEHRFRDLTRPESVYQVVHPTLPGEFPPLGSLDAHPNNLPRELTSFVGREREIADVRRLLMTTRLLTLTGSGGVGKTRLSQRVAADLGPSFPDGVWLVELAGLGDASLLTQAVASVLGIREQPGRALQDTLVDVLRPRSCLLLIDNCEHLVAACAVLADDLLRACPGLTVLATSREPLGIAGETVWRVPPLSMPDGFDGLTSEGGVATLLQSEAVRLFDERARAAFPTFTLTDQQGPAVAQICRRLDGIPLAIELAAARLRGLTLEQLADRLDNHLRLLTVGNRAALPRQQTLRAMVDWSHALLSEPERVLFRRLSVFAGGWTLEAAERVCAGEEIDAADVLELLLQLVERSLVLADERSGDGTPEVRYRLLETLRQYGAEKLEEADETATVRTRHLAWCIDLVEGPGSLMSRTRGLAHARHLDLLDGEHDNLREALRWSLVDAAPETARRSGQRLAGVLWPFWWMRSHFSDGARWLEPALALPEYDDDEGRYIRATVLMGAGALGMWRRDHKRAEEWIRQGQALLRPGEDPVLSAHAPTMLGLAAEARGEIASATALHEESLALARMLSLGWVVGWLLGHLGRLAMLQGEYERATVLLEESLRHFEESGERQGAGWSYQYLARVMERQGNLERAAHLFEQALAASRDVGERIGIAWALGHLGRLARMGGDDGRAEELFGECLRIAREIGDQWCAAWTLGNLGRAALDRREYQRASALFEESLVLCRGLASPERPSAYPVHYLGVVANALGHPERAARLFGAAEALRESGGRLLSPADRAEHQHHVEAVRRVLDEELFHEGWADGRAMSFEQAVEYALVPPHTPRAPATEPVESASDSATSPLSARELEVALLLARGLTNRQVAEALVISERTASTHVTHILTKLGFSTRSQVAAWAVEHGLASQ